MPAYYQKTTEAFVSESPSSIVGELGIANANARFPLTPEAMDAWSKQLPPLKTALEQLLTHYAAARDWHILLEYPVPIVGKRIDAVLLCHNFIIVIETKTGATPTSAARQVDDYALNLASFHEWSAGRKIVPLVVADCKTSKIGDSTAFDTLIEPCRKSSFADLPIILLEICRNYLKEAEQSIDPAEWDMGRFKPIPPIIDAAVALYSDMNVFEIGHACSAREDLDRTTETLVSAVARARDESRKIICFVTGVPGAGKTLVGLNTVHRAEIKSVGCFLSGNGPLVKVIQEALIRDVTYRKNKNERITRRQAELEVRTFIHNVHRFADEYYQDGAPVPVRNVVVFDEAQRAWDAEQNARAKRPARSEPQMMIEVMDRHKDWAVLVALIGGGQEINRGEAGLAEWGRALTGFPGWQIYASPEVLSGGTATAGFRLFDDPAELTDRVHELDSLHLKVCTRSIRAQKISDWVNALLSADPNEAAAISKTLDAKPLLTRSLATARLWLSKNRRGRTRAGLVGSASATRLRADGIEPTFDFHQRFDWEHWFLDEHDCNDGHCDHKYCNDVRCSSRLEVIATQFEIQGLELDWIGLCWGEDFVWNGKEWKCYRFNNKSWKTMDPDKHRTKCEYLRNAYRVLLTRARQGMIIYVPKPPGADTSRLHQGLDSTADFLLDCGAVDADSQSLSRESSSSAESVAARV